MGPAAAFSCIVLLLIGVARSQLSCEDALDAQGNMTGPGAILMDASCGVRIGDYGSYDDCSTIPGAHFCVASVLKSSATAQGMSVGLCIPSVCTASDAESIQRFSPALTPFSASLLSMQCFDSPPALSHKALAVIGLFSALALLVLFASVVDMYRKHVRDGDAPADVDEHPLLQPAAGSSSLREYKNLRLDLNLDGTEELPLMMRALLCFSLPANVRRLSSLPSSSLPSGLSLDFLNGLRVLAMFWVITGHTVLNASYVGFANNYYFDNVIKNSLAFQFWYSAEFAVDVFFVLSGFLVAFLSLRSLASGHPFSFFQFYVSRYMRLTPLLLVSVFLFSQIVPLLTYGPFTDFAKPVQGSPHGDCEKYWWPGLLYISNFYPPNYADVCSGPTWYLSADFQMYLFAPLLFLLFYRARRAACTLLTVLCLASVACTFAIMKSAYPQGSAYDNMIYDKPYTRAAAFLPGVAAAFVVFAEKRREVSPLIRVLIYAIAPGVLLTLVFVPYTQPWTYWGNVLWATFNHVAWGITLSLLIVVFAWKYGGFVNAFLSLSFWAPLARLTYGAYLLHPLVLAAWLGAQTQLFTFSYLALGQWSIAHIFMSYAASLATWLLVEQPIINLTNITVRNR